MQALVITAYRDSEQTYKLAEYLSQKFIVYIHFDKKMNIEKINEQHFEKLSNVHVCSLFHVNWGGASHLWAILYLCKEVLKNKDITYVHIISGGHAEHRKRFMTILKAKRLSVSILQKFQRTN